jgi:hypothetical protein
MSLSAAFSNSRRKLSGNTGSLQGNIVLKPTEFKADTVVGEVMTGLKAGETVEVKYAGTLTMKDYTKKSGKSFVNTDKGGLLRIEGVSEGKDNVYNSRWMLSFNGQPKDSHSIVPDAVCNYIDTGRRDGEDRPKLRINTLVMDGEKHVTTMDGLKEAIESGFAAEGAVTLFGQSDGEVIQAPFFLSGSTVDGKWVANDAAERAAETMASFDDAVEVIQAALETGGFSVVPMRGYSVGPTTAEMAETAIKEAIEKGASPRISTVDPQDYVCPTIGMRLQQALNQKGDNAVPEGAGDKLIAAIKDYADKDEAATLASKGVRGLSDETLTKFFSSVGVELIKHPAAGWSTQALLEDKMDGMDRGFIVKGFQLKATAPYPAVEACKDARAAYYTEMKEAVEGAVAGLRVEAGAKSDAPKAEKPAAAKADAKADTPAAELPDDEGDALDDLLNQVEEEMDPSAG